MTDLTSSRPPLTCWCCLRAMVPSVRCRRSLYLALGLEAVALDRVYRGANLTQQLVYHFQPDPWARPSTRPSRLQTFLSTYSALYSFGKSFPGSQTSRSEGSYEAWCCLLFIVSSARCKGIQRFVSIRLVCVEQFNH